MSHVCGPPTLRGKCQVREFSDVGNLAEYMESENSFFYCHGYKPESRWAYMCVLCCKSDIVCYDHEKLCARKDCLEVQHLCLACVV